MHVYTVCLLCTPTPHTHTQSPTGTTETTGTTESTSSPEALPMAAIIGKNLCKDKTNSYDVASFPGSLLARNYCMTFDEYEFKGRAIIVCKRGALW